MLSSVITGRALEKHKNGELNEDKFLDMVAKHMRTKKGVMH